MRAYIYIIVVSAKDPLRVYINYVISNMGVAILDNKYYMLYLFENLDNKNIRKN